MQAEAPTRIEVQVRVRYPECDPMNVAHHSVYPVWMEIARTELLRARGLSYRECESQGVYFVVARMQIRYRRPAYYDDVLRVEVKVQDSGRAKIDHQYRIWRDQDLLAEADTTLACVDKEGRLRPVPELLL